MLVAFAAGGTICTDPDELSRCRATILRQAGVLVREDEAVATLTINGGYMILGAPAVVLLRDALCEIVLPGEDAEGGE